MSEQVVIDSPGANRRQPLLTEGKEEEEWEKRGHHALIGDFAGHTAACAMVCCCCPCAVVNFIVLAVYKLPAGLFRKAWRKKKKKRLMRKKTKLMMMETGAGKDGSRTAMVAVAETAADASYKGGRSSSTSCYDEFDEDDDWDGSSGPTESGFETEMWDRFHEGGFWRSSLDRED